MEIVAILVLVAIIVLYIINLYNSLVAKRNQVSSVEASVDAQLKRRYDLLPNLVSSVIQYLTHERSVLEKITELRTQAQNASSKEQKFELNGQISSLLPNIKAAFEAYPDLKANQNILHLQESLNEIEEQISAARRAYNSAVERYNNAVEMFPSNIIANSMKFEKAVFFNIPEEETKVHNVGELFKRS